jgi:Na+/H+ antiporter NhaB
VCQREILESEMKLVIGLTEVTGTGLLTRHLFRRIVMGRLAEAASRDLAAKLGVWDGHLSEQTKALFVETVYSALRADSYFAGVVVGTLFRRAAFYLNATPREISLATDAMETKLLFLGAQEAVGRWTDSNTLPWKWLSGKPIVR